MKTAISNLAVDRYRTRVVGAKGFFKESIRAQIQKLVEDGYAAGAVRPHPLFRDRVVIPFLSGGKTLYLSIGPNTTKAKAELSVINIHTERELHMETTDKEQRCPTS
jgi:hypothetical protein